MSLLPVWIVLLSYALVKGCAEALQCYTCDNCTAVNDTMLQLCPSHNASAAVALASTTKMAEVSTTSAPETTEAEPDPVTEVEVDDATEATEAEEPEATDEAASAETEAVEGKDPEPELEALMLSPTSNLTLTRRKRDIASQHFTHHCFSVLRNESGRIRNEKGCIEVPREGSACTLLNSQLSGKNCRVCSEDKCNGAAISNYSLAAALFLIVNTLMQW